MVCVKYCVFTFPLVVTAVQTHGGVSSALRHIHAPTRNEAGTYIRASVASDLDTLSTPNTLSHQGMMMNIFLLGGWVARPSAFYFCACSGSLSYSVWLGRSAFHCRLACSMLNITALCPLCISWSPCLFSVFLVNCVLLCFSVLILTALCRPCLFLVCLAFPHRLALILH